MAQTSREMVRRAVTFDSPARVPRQMWTLPWAEKRFPERLAAIEKRFPFDMTMARTVNSPSARVRGDPYAVGESCDEWGCEYLNLQEGVHGEVKNPRMRDRPDPALVMPPIETFPTDLAAARDTVNRFCAGTQKFVRGSVCPRFWERYQFLRGTENAMMDVMSPEDGMLDVLKVMHEYHLREYEFWVTTDVDALSLMDDWGSQTQLLISPAAWRAIFKPLYREYCQIARSHGKFVFMHSDGHISEIYDDLVEIGITAINSQLFVMDMDDLARRAKGKITFWGEIDRQHVLTSRNPEDGREAVRKVARHFYDPKGGVIAQFEFGPGGNPDVAEAVFEEWERIGGKG